jgi:hypothetical protein
MIGATYALLCKVVPRSELSRFWDAFTNYDGDPNVPLPWWKVGLFQDLHSL